MRLLERDDPHVVATACRALEAYGMAANDAVPALVDATRSPSYRVRRAAFTGLLSASEGSDVAVAALIAGLSDPCWEVRKVAAFCLGVVADAGGGDGSVAELTALLGDPAARVREEAALALAAFGPRARNALETLEALATSEPEEDARAAAVRAVECVRP